MVVFVFCVVYTFAGVLMTVICTVYCTFVHGGPGCRARRLSLFTHHAYADDTQLYLHFGHDEMASFADQLECCILDIDHWMSAKGLKLNVDKTELLFTS